MKQNCITKLAGTAAAAALLGLSAPILGQQPAIYFEFNEGSGNVVRDTITGIEGTILNNQDPEVDNVTVSDLSPSGDTDDRSAFLSGRAFLVAEDTSAEPVLAFGPEEAFTVEAWVYPDASAAPETEGIVTYGNSYKLGFQNPNSDGGAALGKIVFTLLGEVDLKSTNLVAYADGWHHIAAVWEPGVGATLYVDGQSEFIANTDDRPRAYSNNYLVLGAENLRNNLRGNLDRVRIHEGALTAEQLDTVAATPKPVYENTVVAYDFNETEMPFENAKEPLLPTMTSIELLGDIWSQDDPDAEPADYSLSFDGVRRATAPVPSTVISTNSGAFLDYTLEAWVKLPDELPSSRMIMYTYDGNPGFAFSIETDGTLHTTTYTKNDIRSSVEVPRDGEWHHVAVVHENGVEMQFYVDGNLRQRVPYTRGPGVRSNENLGIGAALGGANAFTGMLDRIRISGEALSPDQFDADLPPGGPVFTSHPATTEVNRGEQVVLTANVTGTGLSYQWLFRPLGSGIAEPIEGATSSTYTISNAQLANQGHYTLTASNESWESISREAEVTVVTPPLEPTQPGLLEQVWVIEPGERDYITPGDPSDAQRNNTERGIAYNPVTDHVLVVARETSPILRGVFVLDADTGAEVGQLDISGIEGGTIVLIKIGVADDGAIYAANFGSYRPTGTQTTIYRWENESAVPTIAFKGDPTPDAGNQQWGKNFAVRGSGENTQILMESRNQVLALFTTTDGETFSPTTLTSTAPADAFSIGLDFGEGNTFWGKALNAPLLQMEVDPTTGVADPVRTYPEVRARLAGIAVDIENNLVAGINVDPDAPDALEIYDISDPEALELLDSEPWPTAEERTNSGLSGNAAFGANNMVFALNTNNGLVAYRMNRGEEAPELSVTRSGDQIAIDWADSATGYQLQATDLLGAEADWTTVDTGGETEHTTTTSGDARFFRLVR